MAAIKPTADIARKWSTVTPQRSAEYEAGVKAPRVSWSAAAKAAEQTYKDGIVAAAAQGRYGKGVLKAGDAKWAARAAGVGPGRFAEGVATSASAFETGFAPYQAVISGLTLPPRYSKGDVRNLDRVKAVSNALRLKKLSI